MKFWALCPALLATAATAVLFGDVPADASVAKVAIEPGGLTLSSPSITVVGRNPTELEVKTSVIDARGTGAGWFVSLAAFRSSASGTPTVASALSAFNAASDTSPPSATSATSAASAPSASSASRASNLVVTAGAAACLPNSACTLPVNDVPYPVTVESTGTRSEVFEADPASGLGAQSVDMTVMVPGNAPNGLQLALSVSTQP